MLIENKVRIHLAICIDSAGYVETYRRLSDKIGVNLGKVHEEMNRTLDVIKLYLRKYRKRLVVRTKKKLIFFEKLRTQATKMVKENRKNLQYGSGISRPFAEDSQMAGT
jgi:CHAD domain-containing protein